MKRRKKQLQQPAQFRIFDGFNMRVKKDKWGKEHFEWRLKNCWGTLLITCPVAALEKGKKEDVWYTLEYPERPLDKWSDWKKDHVDYERILNAIKVIVEHSPTDLDDAEYWVKDMEGWFIENPPECWDCPHHRWQW